MKKLMFLMMLFGFILIATDNASAQKLCSKVSDGVKVDFVLGNATNGVFELIPVDQNCKEIRQKLQTVPNDGDMYNFSSYKDAVFRVRQVGTGKLLVEIVIDPAKPIMLVQTGVNDENPELISVAREDNSASKPEKTEVPETEIKTGDDKTSSPVVPASDVLFKEDDKKNCSSPTPGKKIALKWKNPSKDYSLEFILIDSNCEAKGKFQSIAPGETFTGFAYEGQIFYAEESGGESPLKLDF